MASFNLDAPPFRTPVLAGKTDVINTTNWVRWLSSLVRAVNQQTVPVAVANLPSAPTVGMLVAITDSTVTTWGATITGGGANTVLGHWNGSVWTVAAK